MSFFKRVFFNLWYFRRPPWDTNITPPEVHDYLQHHPPGRALDVGCGTGTNVITLAQHGWQAVGVDFIPKAIRTARRKAQQAGVAAQFHVDDARYLDSVAPAFDLILDIGCFHSLNQGGKEIYTRRVDQLLRPGGNFLIYLFFQEQAGADSSGAGEADLARFAAQWELAWRVDGSERGERPSAWLQYTKPTR